MSVHLPTPHPDELLYSVICRLLTRTGWTSRIASVQLFGDGTWCNVDLCGRLDVLASNLGPELPLSADDILNQLTLFPFYAAGASPEARSEVARLLKEETSHHAHAKLGVLAQTIVRPTRLRFCPTCRDEDLQSVGETYWRRSHQLPGVLACSRHATMLADSEVRAKSLAELGYRDATQVLRDADGVGPGFESAQVERAHAVARMCSALLDEPWGIVRNPLGLEEARALARRKGMTGAWGGIDHRRLAAYVVDFFGADLIEAMGFSARPSPSGELYWLKKHFVDFRHNIFPVSAIALATALHALPDVPEPAQPFKRGVGRPPRRPRPGELEEWRREWARTVETAAPPKVSNARRKAQGLVLKLRAWDGEWYRAFNARHRVLRSSGVDYAARDDEILGKLRVAHLELLADDEGPRRSARAILARAKVGPTLLRPLPKSKGFLAAHEEDRAAHHRRRLRAAAERLLAAGRRPTLTSLALEGQLSYDSVRKPEVVEFARSLCALVPEDHVRRSPRASHREGWASRRERTLRHRAIGRNATPGA